MKSLSWDFTVDWRKLRLLHELDRRGTIAAVAETMYLTPSAVSQQLAGLAREVGAPLLERRGRTVVLTGQARVLLAHAEEMRELAERTRAALDAWADGTEGYVRVGALATGIAALVGPAIVRLRTERPGLTVRVSEQEPGEALDLLDAGELEVAVTVDYPGAPAREDARYRRVDLISDVMDAVVPAGHPLAGRPSVNLAELACDVWVGAAASDACGHIMTGICAAAGFSPDVQYHCREWDAVAALVAAGVGVALIPRSAQPLRPRDLAVLPVAGAPATRLLFALTRAGTEQDPATRAVLHALEAVAAARPLRTTWQRAEPQCGRMRTMPTPVTKPRRFLDLHRPGQPLLLPNPWDQGAAKILASLGFAALATTSSGFAATLGRPDGSVTLDEALMHAAAIVAATDLPVSADLENCFADDAAGVARTVRLAAETGLAGCSIEDFSGSQLYDRAEAVDRVAAAVAAARDGDFVLTARAENYLRGNPDLADTIARLQAYQEAGADVLYAPGLTRIEDIRALVGAVDRPVNVLAMPGAPPVAELAEAGVSRISVGGAFAFAALSALVDAATELRDKGTYGFHRATAAGRQATRAAFGG